MLDRLRGSLASLFASLGKAAARAIPNPTAWTAVGLALAFVSSLFYAGRHEIIGGLLLALSGFFDILDGAVARAAGRTSQRGAFLDSTMDRVSEVAVFVGILVGGEAGPFLVVTALSLSLLVSYARAKGDALGVNLAGVGIGERSERLLVLIVASLLHVLAIGVLIVILLALITFLQRTVAITRALGPKLERKTA